MRKRTIAAVAAFAFMLGFMGVMASGCCKKTILADTGKEIVSNARASKALLTLVCTGDNVDKESCEAIADHQDAIAAIGRELTGAATGKKSSKTGDKVKPVVKSEEPPKTLKAVEPKPVEVKKPDATAEPASPSPTDTVMPTAPAMAPESKQIE